jgi:hypothetical protein
MDGNASASRVGTHRVKLGDHWAREVAGAHDFIMSLFCLC